MNMDTFLNATKHFTDGDKIRTILEVCKAVEGFGTLLGPVLPLGNLFRACSFPR